MSVQEQLNHLTKAIGILTGKIDEVNEKLEKNDKNIQDVKDMLQDRVKEVEDKLEGIIHRVSVLEARHDHFDDNNRRVNNLLISGIPYTDGENLKDIYSLLSTKLGYSSPPDADVFRYKGNDANKRPVVLKFATEFQKRHYFERYFKVSKNLLLDVFPGFKNKKTRVYLQQDFTSAQYKLFRAAMNHKKAGKVSQVRVSQGRITVKLREGGAFMMFSSADALDHEINRIRPMA
jgi:hypothetical protein